MFHIYAVCAAVTTKKKKPDCSQPATTTGRPSRLVDLRLFDFLLHLLLLLLLLLFSRAPAKALPTLNISTMADEGDLKEAKLFVYGVNRNCPREVLEETFGKVGQVEDVHITDKGYAFVTMTDPNDIDNAIAELNGSTMDGQEIKVDRATGRKGGGGGRGRRRGGGEGSRVTQTRVFLLTLASALFGLFSPTNFMTLNLYYVNLHS